MSEPGPDVFPQLVRVLKQLNELARRNKQFEMAQTFKSMARQAGPDDIEPLLVEIFDLWHEARRGKLWEFADGIRFGLQSLPGLVIEERPGSVPRWHFVDTAP